VNDVSEWQWTSRDADPEVVPLAERRRFTAKKLRIVAEADACTAPGKIGAFAATGGILVAFEPVAAGEQQLGVGGEERYLCRFGRG
jgi:hypothetical protein